MISKNDEGQVLGIDIGYSETKRTTGICIIKWSESEINITLKNIPTEANAQKLSLKKLLNDGRFRCAALDAPIRRGFDIIGIYRVAELMLTRGFQPFIGKPGQASSGNGIKLNSSANEVAKFLIELDCVEPANHKARIHDKAIVEAFPTSFLGTMLDYGQFPWAGAKSDIYFEYLLGPEHPQPKPPTNNRLKLLIEKLLPGRELKGNPFSMVRDHEERAAIVCSLTALCVVVKQYVAVGDPLNGYIILPPLAIEGSSGLQPWAWDLLQKNKPAGNPNSIIVESE